MVITWPLSMPAGMFTVAVRVARTRPAPPHPGHFSVITWPVPLQAEHGRCVTMDPKSELVVVRTVPVPLQTVHLFREDPSLAPVPWHASQFSLRWNLKVFLHPKAASSNVMVTS